MNTPILEYGATHKFWPALALALLVAGSVNITYADGLKSGKSLISQIATEEIFTGKVTDARGDALPGVSVLVKGTTKGTTTEGNGTYSISANIGDVLVFSFVGFDSKEVKISGSQSIDVRLGESSSLLNEVIVTGTRSGGRTKIDTPVPVDVIPLAEITIPLRVIVS